MILTDASAVVALLDADEPDHVACVEALTQHTPPMLTTLPALSEACFLLRRRRNALPHLWTLVRRRDLVVHYLDDGLLGRSVELMERYADVPIALADATLVAVAEALGEERIFTLDGDFRIYCMRSGRGFLLSP